MTVDTIIRAKDLVEEMQADRMGVGSVWEYTNTMSRKLLFAVFPLDQFCDIHESPYVDRPVRIWKDGLWIGKYKFMNEVE